ncbi:MAG TPA: hypothetical protein VEH27_19645 [Methylomirabilota bacterium]|nr:hypothetical protein [Methylomirabilota bacterium]
MRIIRQTSRLLSCALACAGLHALAVPSVNAATFTNNFNAGIPPEITLLGNAADYDHSNGGFGNTNTGTLKITEAVGSQQGTAILQELDPGVTVGAFDARFQLFIGAGNGADGFSFVFGDFADASFGEEGPGTLRGLTISFDVYNNGGTVAEAPAIDVKWNNVILGHRRVAAASTTTGAQPIGTANTIRTQTTQGGGPVYWPVRITVDQDGTLDVAYNNVVVYTNFPIFRPLTGPAEFGPGYRFAFGARTGGSFDSHWVDELGITTTPANATSGQPYITSVQPVVIGSNASAVGGVEILLQDAAFAVNQSTVKLSYNNAAVTPTVTHDAATGITRVVYRGANGTLPTGAQPVRLQYSSTATPAVTFDYTFTAAIDPFATIPASYKIASVDTTKPGFKVYTHAIEGIRAPGDRNQTILAERSLANGFIDPATGQPYPNLADLSAAGPDGLFVVEGVVNWNQDAPANAGNFNASSTPPREDQPIPGAPSTSSTPIDNHESVITTFLHLKPGGYRFGFNSDDGFRASFGPGWDATTPLVGQFNGGRGASDTLFDVVITEEGYYPFRLSWWEGTGGANAEFFSLDPDTGARILINDPENPKAIKAYRESAVSRPSITSALPVRDWIAAAADDDVIIKITDGSLAVDQNSIALYINGAAQTVTKSKSGAVTTVVRDSSVTNLLPSGANNVQVVYSFNEGGSLVTLTNAYTFSVAPYYGVLPPGNRVAASSVSPDTGFSARVNQIDRTLDNNQGNGGRIGGGSDANRMPFPEIQLNNGMINSTNGQPYPNLAAPGPNGNYTYEFDLFNFNMANSAGGPAADSGLITGAAPAAPFTGQNPDQQFPGLPGSGTSVFGLENYVMEVTTYLELKRGVYIFAVNSDDGFLVSSAPNPKDTLGTILGFYVGGRGNSGNLVAPVGGNPPPIWAPSASADDFGSTPFNVIVQEDGIYPFRILYWQGGTGVNAEFLTINKQTGAPALVNDPTVEGSVKAYKRSTEAEARPWVKFSVSPTPWEVRQMQSGPGPLTMIGRTPAAANSSDIYNMSNDANAHRRAVHWADVIIGATIGNGVGDASLGLLLNGQRVTPTFTTNGTDVTISYRPPAPLPSGSTNIAGLIYGGVTNFWPFGVQTYGEAKVTDKVQGTGGDRGFSVKVVQSAAARSGGNTATAAETHLAGNPANIAVAGPAEGGRYIIPGIINWNDNRNTGGSGAEFGNFQINDLAGWPFPKFADQPVPGVPGTGSTSRDHIAAEVFAYLEFPTAGYQRLGANADDGVALKIGTPGVTNGTTLFTFDRGAGAQDIPMSFTIPEPGLYPVRLLWWEGTGGGQLEFFSYGPNGEKIPINSDLPGAIKAYTTLAASNNPKLTVTRANDGTITISWTNGGVLEATPSLQNPQWTQVDTESPFAPAANDRMMFFRVRK